MEDFDKVWIRRASNVVYVGRDPEVLRYLQKVASKQLRAISCTNDTDPKLGAELGELVSDYSSLWTFQWSFAEGLLNSLSEEESFIPDLLVVDLTGYAAMSILAEASRSFACAVLVRHNWPGRGVEEDLRLKACTSHLRVLSRGDKSELLKSSEIKNAERTKAFSSFGNDVQKV